MLIVQQQQNVVNSSGQPAAARTGGSNGVEVVEVLRPVDEPHIEKQLVARIVALHQRFVSNNI